MGAPQLFPTGLASFIQQSNLLSRLGASGNYCWALALLYAETAWSTRQEGCSLEDGSHKQAAHALYGVPGHHYSMMNVSTRDDVSSKSKGKAAHTVTAAFHQNSMVTDKNNSLLPLVEWCRMHRSCKLL